MDKNFSVTVEVTKDGKVRTPDPAIEEGHLSPGGLLLI
jgi:hypothetical protein